MAITPQPRGVIELDRTPLFQNTQQLLRRAEAEVRLIDRAQPTNVGPEREALILDFGAGRARAPNFEYAAPPALGPLRAALSAAAAAIGGLGALGAAYAARALELECEAEAAEQVGTAEFAACCARRYPVESSPDADLADDWAARWIQAADDAQTMLHRSDDRADPESLVCALERATEGLPVRVQIRNQAAAAAVGEGFIGVRAGLWHSRAAVTRIVLHEIEGHVRPRVLAQREPLGLFRVGSAKSNDDEEGRALLLERGAGVLDGARRRELARRHLAARAVRSGASFQEIVKHLLGLGQDITSAVEAACRALRGGGLAREYVYLVSLARVTRAFEAEPELEGYFEHGRVSVDAARACRAGFGFRRD
ncbi:MAG TPA: tyrosine/phenylalanine carboxypeptidase domain-containing protein [Polyangiaceae bacterium]|nr:tyrosine/phenylalanine carboxypeptidase domain-containing protein [Polyangiaceae bacterium]